MLHSNQRNSGSDFKSILLNLWHKLKELTVSTSHKVQQSLADEENAKLYSAIAYLPFAGPLLVFMFKRSQRLSLIHAQNAGYLQISFLILLFAVWLLENLPIISSILKLFLFVPFITDAITYLGTVLFISFSAIGAYNGYKGNVWIVPYLNEFINNILYKKNSDIKKIEGPK